MKKKHYLFLFFAIITVLIFLDQWLKIWVKMNMTLHENIPVLGEWFQLYFIENEGMAFGLSFGENIGKLILSLLRVGISGFMIYYVIQLIKKKKIDTIVLVIFSLIIAGALGNIIDSCFYGMIFGESTPMTVATACPPEGGYAGLFYGKVVDMFYVKLFLIPEWVPGWGGHYFFPAIFNIADSCVTLGLIGLLIFNKRIFIEKKKEENVEENQEKTA